jgi:hypothetical protein
MSLYQRTKHIKAKYFLIKEYYDAGVIDIKFCPTDQMWADVLTKLLQGQKFRDMRVFLQNCPQDYEDDTEVVSPIVRQNSIQANKQRLKRLLRKPRYSRRSTGTQLKNKSTGTRKSTSTQLVRSTGTQLRSRSTGTRKSTSTLVVPSRSTSSPVGNNAWLGTARPVKLTWRVGVSGNKETKQ